MAINKDGYQKIMGELNTKGVTLVAVSKTKPVESILELYQLGQRDFGENYVQEMVEKAKLLPYDIRWHFIGHVQTNKVKLIIPFVQLIHGVDSLKLLKEINKEAVRTGRIINCLLQIHIAEEETKFGLDESELDMLMKNFSGLELKSIRICGLMGMASFTNDMDKVRSEFNKLKKLFKQYQARYSGFQILSMGMSADYKIAVEEGSNMVRIGSLIMGERTR